MRARLEKTAFLRGLSLLGSFSHQYNLTVFILKGVVALFLTFQEPKTLPQRPFSTPLCPNCSIFRTFSAKVDKIYIDILCGMLGLHKFEMSLKAARNKWRYKINNRPKNITRKTSAPKTYSLSLWKYLCFLELFTFASI